MSLQINDLISLFIKIFVITGSIIYLIFALLIVKQVNTLSKNIFDRFNNMIITASYMHLIFAGVLVFLVIVLL